MAHLILFKEKTGKLSWVNCDDLDDFYKHLDCRCFDVVSAGFNDLEIYVDDEGLLVHRLLTAVDSKLKPALVGSLIFAKHDDVGETMSCTEEDMKEIKRRILSVYDFEHGDKFKIVRLGE